jgi:DNA-binding NtrC family response regulator
MCDQEIKAEHLGISVRLDLSAIEEAIRTLPEVAAAAARKAEVEAIERALRLTGGNKSKAAEFLGVSYKTLLNKVKEYGVGSVASDEAEDVAAPPHDA